MHLRHASRYFDRTLLDVYSRVTESWATGVLRAQLRPSDTFVPIWNRPTRKRMINTATTEDLESAAVIRIAASGEIFMVGTIQQDVQSNRAYRKAAGLFRVGSTAVITRRAPVGPSNNPGWAVETVVARTYGDAELRSVNENQQVELDNYGHYFLFMPHDAPLLRHDVVSLPTLGKTFYVLLVYIDTGLVCARVTELEDVRVDFTYIRIGPPVYDDTTSTNVPVETSFNVTGIIEPISEDDIQGQSANTREIKIMVKRAWFPDRPALEDKIVFEGMRYRITVIDTDAEAEEWVLRATR